MSRLDGPPVHRMIGEADHRGWTIRYDPPPIPDRRFDYCATDPNGDGEPNAHGRDVAECRAEIDRILEEREDEA